MIPFGLRSEVPNRRSGLSWFPSSGSSLVDKTTLLFRSEGGFIWDLGFPSLFFFNFDPVMNCEPPTKAPEGLFRNLLSAGLGDIGRDGRARASK